MKIPQTKIQEPHSVHAYTHQMLTYCRRQIINVILSPPRAVKKCLITLSTLVSLHLKLPFFFIKSRTEKNQVSFLSFSEQLSTQFINTTKYGRQSYVYYESCCRILHYIKLQLQ